MIFKKLLKYTAVASAIVVLYLATAAVWASLSVDDLLPGSTSNERNRLTQQQTDMLLRIEDPTFFQHAGLDVSRGQGLTTITSSLARSVFLSGKQLTGARGYFQSFYEVAFDCCKKIDLGRDVMALVLHRRLSKAKQLELFVSTVYMGRHNRRAVTGLADAANIYFDKDLPNLSAGEFATLVAMIKAPNVYHPVRGAERLESRVSRVTSILAGTCEPSGWLDTEYEHCQRE
jgi:membrane carboxypeptidase/penicillin-binding protein